MKNKFIRYVAYLKKRYILRKTRIARYIELKRLSRMRRRTIPRYSHCKNCGEKLLGMYCYHCGQYALDVNQPFWQYINKFLENTYQLDGRLLQTLRFLFTRPGFISKEYVEGKVNSYVHPLKLYMCVSLIFFSFALMIYSGDTYSDKVVEIFINEKSENKVSDKIDQYQDSSIVTSIDISNLKKEASNYKKDNKNLINENSSEIVSDNSSEKKREITTLYSQIFSGILKYYPIMIMLLMPLYAYIQYKAFRKSKKVYLHSFVFSIHIHTVFLILAIFVALLYPYVDKWLIMIAVPLLVIYNIIATKVFYNRGWIISIFKSVVNMSLYGLVLVLAMLVVSIMILVDIGK